ncbi:hypothetical protein DFS33DRAFT_1487777 [Desarmillaria ectypa]|nr:hypothetical protein DFS33DRAFT_1487777 [Desarmillaria ectypa]
MASIHPPTTIDEFTRIWTANVHWRLYEQCGVWDPQTRGVQVWVCIREHHSTQGTEPPNTSFWQYIGRG